MTPNLAIIRIHGNRWWGVELPIVLPLFLLWIPTLLLGTVLLLPALLLWLLGLTIPLRWAAGLWRIVCSLPGTSVRVCAQGHRVSVRIV